jgi:hypothetical protein
MMREIDPWAYPIIQADLPWWLVFTKTWSLGKSFFENLFVGGEIRGEIKHQQNLPARQDNPLA